MHFGGLVALSFPAAVAGILGGTPAFHESFDDVVLPLLPTGWGSSQSRVAGANDFVSVSSSPHTPPNAVQCTNATVAQWITSPTIAPGDKILRWLSFWTRRSSTFQADLVIEASAESTDATYVGIGDTLRFTGGTSYEYHEMPIPQQIGSCPRVRFRWRVLPGSSGTTGTLRLDDVEIAGGSAQDISCRRIDASPRDPRDGEIIELHVLMQNLGTLPSASRRLDILLARSLDSISRSFETIKSVELTNPLFPGDSSWAVIPFAVRAPGGRIWAVVEQEGDGESSNDSASMVLPVSYARGAVVINEIMYAPAPDEPEWVEVGNPGEDTLFLTAWSISDAVTSSKHPLPSQPIIISPHGFVVLAKDASGMEERYGRLPCPVLQVTGFPSLNNGGDAVVLYDHTGGTVDSVGYAVSWGGSEGKSLERRAMTEASQDPLNWVQCVDSNSGTPGQENSLRRLARDVAVRGLRSSATGGAVLLDGTILNDGTEEISSLCVVLRIAGGIDPGESSAVEVARRSIGRIPARDSAKIQFEWMASRSGIVSGWLVADDPADQRPGNNSAPFRVAVPSRSGQLVVNEIMFHPSAGRAEYVELYNPGDDFVDLRGWRIHDGSTGAEGNPRCVLPESIGGVAGKGYFVVSTDSSFCAQWGGKLPAGCQGVGILDGAFALNDDADNIVLHDAAGTVIDSVPYRSEWHNPALVSAIGRSIERISPSMPSGEGRSWTSSAAPEGGTPGRRNSAFASPGSAHLGVECSPSPFSPDGDGVDDVTVVRYTIPLAVATISISVYDIKGRRIRRIADHDPGVSSGAAVWDGRRDDGVRAPVGIYVVLLRGASATDGPVYEARCLVVLAVPL